MTEERIARLNELARKSKTIGLTEEEKQAVEAFSHKKSRSRLCCARSIWPPSARAWRPSWTTSTLWKRMAPRPS